MDRESAPPLDVRFCSRQDEVCDVPLLRDQIVVAPSLLGCDSDLGTFGELRDSVGGARDGPTRSVEEAERCCCCRGDGVRVKPVSDLERESPALRAALLQICRYFSMDEDRCDTGIAYLRGAAHFQHPSLRTYVQNVCVGPIDVRCAFEPFCFSDAV
jgi:hypothetical protein